MIDLVTGEAQQVASPGIDSTGRGECTAELPVHSGIAEQIDAASAERRAPQFAARGFVAQWNQGHGTTYSAFYCLSRCFLRFPVMFLAQQFGSVWGACRRRDGTWEPFDFGLRAPGSRRNSRLTHNEATLKRTQFEVSSPADAFLTLVAAQETVRPPWRRDPRGIVRAVVSGLRPPSWPGADASERIVRRPRASNWCKPS
jgi:hypothetical protein